MCAPATLLLALVSAACGDSRAFPIPDRTVVLTFDDASKSHLRTVVPVLREMGFSATFFVNPPWVWRDPANHLNWQEVAELHRLGFEVGDHSWSHRGFEVPHAAALLEEEIRLMREALAQVGVPAPVSFAWPGDSFGPEARTTLLESGYRYARRGSGPEAAPARAGVGVGQAFDPLRHDALLVPTTGTAAWNWDLEKLRSVVSKAKDGRAAVLQFHGVPDTVNTVLSVKPAEFRRFMSFLKEEGYRAIALRDLAEFGEPVPRPADPNTKVRFAPE